MQTGDRVLAGRYGRALFLAAEAAREEERVFKDLAESQSALLGLQGFLRNPRVSSSDKKKRLAETLGARVCPLTLKFFSLLIDKKRFELLPLIAANLARFIAEKKNTAKAQVKSAKPLPSEAQEILKKRLTAFSGKTVELEMREDPELIGGVIVRLGDWVLDASLRGALRQMKETFNGN